MKKESEIILRIEYLYDFPTGAMADFWVEHRSCTYEGAMITTNKRELALLISNQRQCCESWGYLTTPDDVKHFIGAELEDLKISRVYRMNNPEIQTLEQVKGLAEMPELRPKEDTCMEFITLFTSKGELTFTVYNSHNGFYSHGVRVAERPRPLFKILHDVYL